MEAARGNYELLQGSQEHIDCIHTRSMWNTQCEQEIANHQKQPTKRVQSDPRNLRGQLRPAPTARQGIADEGKSGDKTQDRNTEAANVLAPCYFCVHSVWNREVEG